MIARNFTIHGLQYQLSERTGALLTVNHGCTELGRLHAGVTSERSIYQFPIQRAIEKIEEALRTVPELLVTCHHFVRTVV